MTDGSKAPTHNPGLSVGKGEGSDATPLASPGGPSPGMTREELERVRRREPAALALLFDRYFERVYGLVHRLMGERGAAEDLTQEVFVKVHRAAEQIDPGRDPGPWLMTIAHNACRDVWRSNPYKLRRNATSIDEHPRFGESLTRGVNDPEHDLITREREERVRAAIRKLPEPLRVAVVLHDYQGLGHEEIAALTGLQHAAARKRYSRALTALAKLLEDTLT